MRATLACILALSVAACVDTKSVEIQTASFEVTWAQVPTCGVDGGDVCPYDSNVTELLIDIRALAPSGELDTAFDGTVLVSLVPSGILEDGSLLPDGRKTIFVEVTGGEALNVPVRFYSAFGEVTVLVEDFGYTKSTDVLQSACYDIFPSPGCYALDDDDPAPGSGAAGVGPSIAFDNPRLYDVQMTDRESVGELAGWPSPLVDFRPTIDGVGRDVVVSYPADCVAPDGTRRELLVVTGIEVAGFYVTDVCSESEEWASMYAFNFNTPEDLAVGDCLESITGTVAEFQGFTEMKNPFWTVWCDPADPSCADAMCADVVPPAAIVDSTRLADGLQMEALESGLVTVQNVTVAEEFRSCDLNGNGDVSGSEEWDCDRTCGNDVTCQTLETYTEFFQWTVQVGGAEINVITRGVVDTYDPTLHTGETITRITGILRHLEFGRPPWTIVPRTEADFIL